MADDKQTVDKIFTVVRDAVCILAPGGRFEAVNVSWSRLLGESPDGKNLVTYVHPDDVEGIKTTLSQVFEEDGPRSFNCRLRRGEGDYVRLQWKTAIMPDGNVLATAFDQRAALDHQNRMDEKNALLHLAENGAGMGFWKLHLSSQKLIWSEHMFRIYGLDPAGVEPDVEAAVAFYHEDDRQAVRDHLESAIADRKEFNYKLRLLRGEGDERKVLCHGGPVLDPQGNVVAVHGTLTDITELEESVRHERRTEQRYQDIAAFSYEISWETDVQGRLSYINGPVERVLGLGEKDLVGRHLSEFAPDEEAEGIFHRISGGTQAHASFMEEEQQIIAQDGRQLWLSVSGKPYRNELGAFAGFRGTAMDVTGSRARLIAIDRLHDLLDRTENSPAEALNGLLEIGARFFNLPYGIISRIEEDVYEVQYAISPSQSLKPGQKVQLENTYCWHVCRADGPVAYTHAGQSEIKSHPCYKTLKLETYVGTPVRVGGGMHGTLNFANKTTRTAPFADEDFRFMQLLAHWAGYLIDRDIDRKSLAQTREMLKRRSVIDDLTGVYNRRYIREVMEQEFNRSQRYERPLTLLVLDADNFKAINNAYGAEAGDLALKTMVWACKDNLRDTDVLGRYGGEEFVVLLAETSASRGATIAERIRIMVEKSAMVFGEATVNFTVSIGMSDVREGDEDIMDVLRRADHALLQAKAEGKNRVFTA